MFGYAIFNSFLKTNFSVNLFIFSPDSYEIWIMDGRNGLKFK